MKRIKSLVLCLVIIAVLAFAFHPPQARAESGGPQGGSTSQPAPPPPSAIPWWILLLRLIW